jgi:hypothetical protein
MPHRHGFILTSGRTHCTRAVPLDGEHIALERLTVTASVTLSLDELDSLQMLMNRDPGLDQVVEELLRAEGLNARVAPLDDNPLLDL